MKNILMKEPVLELILNINGATSGIQIETLNSARGGKRSVGSE